MGVRRVDKVGVRRQRARVEVSSQRVGVIGGPGSPVASFSDYLGATGPQGRRIETICLEAGAARSDTPRDRRMRLFEAIRRCERAGAVAVYLPDWSGQLFRSELMGECSLAIPDFLRELAEDLAARARRDGPFVAGLWAPEVERAALAQVLAGPGVTFRFADRPDQLDGWIASACALVSGGARVLVPAPVEVAAVAALAAAKLPIIDAPAWLVTRGTTAAQPRPKPFKIGIVGGVGPAATVDFLDKIVKATPARRDQDHLKVVVEQNPQIPDRTRNLIHGEPDPTIPLYATCRRLEDAGADIITIPCNTAHAYVEDLQRHLTIPIVSMLRTTIEHIAATYGTTRKVGLLATTGTVRTGVYHAVARGSFDLMVPDDAHQELVMASIYGPLGVKAGYQSGQCLEDLLAAVRHLVARGAEILILGCTELPVLIDESDDYRVGDRRVVMLDPTNLLARRCVALALASREAAAGR